MVPERRLRVAALAKDVASLSLALVGACSGDRNEQLDRRHELDVATVIAAETAFAGLAVEAGTREAFLANLADEAILFRPRAVRARAWYESQNPNPGLLSWHPVLADASAAGDLGFTTGPWTYRPDRSGQPVAFGNYLTMWRRGDDGRWRVVIDHGTSNPEPDSVPGLVHPEHERRTSEARRFAVQTADEARPLLDADRAFSGDATSRGFHAALAGYVSADVRALRNGMDPIIGITSLRDHVNRQTGALAWRPLGGSIAGSRDLGYTYGEYWTTSPTSDSIIESGNYLRVWRNTGVGQANWRVVVDLMSPIPPSSD